jgi:hypothetical protein
VPNEVIITLWPAPREDYPDDRKEPIPCRSCGDPGWPYFSQKVIDEIKPTSFQCNECSVAETLVKRATKVYEGRPDGIVLANGKPLTPEKSLKVRNHSPTGFSWGYNGSGPAQLALAILLDLLAGDMEEELALRWYQRFKNRVVASWPQGEGWKITGAEIEAALFAKEAASA